MRHTALDQHHAMITDLSEGYVAWAWELREMLGQMLKV